MTGKALELPKLNFTLKAATYLSSMAVSGAASTSGKRSTIIEEPGGNL